MLTVLHAKLCGLVGFTHGRLASKPPYDGDGDAARTAGTFFCGSVDDSCTTAWNALEIRCADSVGRIGLAIAGWSAVGTVATPFRLGKGGKL